MQHSSSRTKSRIDQIYFTALKFQNINLKKKRRRLVSVNPYHILLLSEYEHILHRCVDYIFFLFTPILN